MTTHCAYDELVSIGELRPHPLFPKYSADKTGRIFSDYKKSFLKQQLRKDGYLQVQIHGKNTLAHRFVFECHSFLLNELEINHIDGNKTNNCMNNLEACTRSQNIRHSVEVLQNKHVKSDQENSNAKIMNNDYPIIKRMLLVGIPKKVIAEAFGVNRATIIYHQKNIEFSTQEIKDLQIIKKKLEASGRRKRWK